MPQVGRVEVYIMVEDQTRWLAFEKGEIDFMNMEGPLAPNAIGKDGKLLPALAAKYAESACASDRYVEPEIRFMYQQLELARPRVGGLGRRSRSRCAARSRCPTTSRGTRARHPQRPGGRGRLSIPPGVVGHVPQLEERRLKFDPAARPTPCSTSSAAAKRGRRRPDRNDPRRAPMVIRYAARPTRRNRQLEELVKKSYDAIGDAQCRRPARHVPELLKLEAVALQPRGRVDRRLSDGDNFFCSSSTVPTRTRATTPAGKIPEYDALCVKKSTHAAGARSATSCSREMARILEATRRTA